MSDLAPLDESITLQQLDEDPYPIYQRLRNEAPVLRVKATGRTMLTKAEDTKYVKDNPELFSSDDPNTPMKRAFQAHTLMRKDGEAHMRERMAMAPAFSPKVIRTDWMPQYMRVAEEYVARLPRGEIVDLFPALSGPYAARGLGILLGIEEASDDDSEYESLPERVESMVAEAVSTALESFRVTNTEERLLKAQLRQQLELCKLRSME